jgi:cytochrome P450
MSIPLHLKFRTSWGYCRVLFTCVIHAFSKQKLPPGNISNLYTRELTDQTYLLKQFKLHGPIIKTRLGEFLAIGVLGLKRCRQLLNEHQDKLPSVSFELKPIIPHGYLRGMEGETHKTYRGILMRGIQPEAMKQNQKLYEGIIAEAIDDYVASNNQNFSAQSYIGTLDTIGQSIMLHIFFGVRPNTNYSLEVTSIYKRMWDKHWHFYCKPEQVAAYEELKATLLHELKNDKGGSDVSDSIMGRIHAAGTLDETIHANLIYMVETGRFAVYSLMRWASKYAVENPDVFRLIANDPDALANDQSSLAHAFVQETLRLNQTERLLRHVSESFVFEGVLFPKGSIARLSLWESHKDEDTFPDPFSFNPQRFIENKFSLDEFDPFGLGSHRCPLGTLSIQICRLYLHYLATHFELEGINNGPPFRGIAHYEPAKDFTVRLHSKQQTG